MEGIYVVYLLISDEMGFTVKLPPFLSTSLRNVNMCHIYHLKLCGLPYTLNFEHVYSFLQRKTKKEKKK